MQMEESVVICYHPHQKCLYSSIFQCHEHDVIKCRYLTNLSWIRDYFMPNGKATQIT